jgi:GNAT superfamily N-acetyltransferase
MPIEPYAPQHQDAVVRLSLRAWEPVFVSLEQALGADVFGLLYPDWRASQQQAVVEVCAAADTHVWVAIEADAPLGFVAVKLDAASRVGEVYMVAVDPAAQRRGIGSALVTFATDWMRAAGMAVAMIGTGGDPGHAPARRAYEKLGFGPLPLVQYYKKLEPLAEPATTGEPTDSGQR